MLPESSQLHVVAPWPDHLAVGPYDVIGRPPKLLERLAADLYSNSGRDTATYRPQADQGDETIHAYSQPDVRVMTNFP